MEEPIKVRLDEFLNSLKGDDVAINGKVTGESNNVATVLLDPNSVAVDSPEGGLLSDDIALRLHSFGIEEVDQNLINYFIKKVHETVRNLTNLDEIPEGLHYKVVEAVCAEYLGLLYSMGKLQIEVSSSVYSIKEGDTEVRYKEAKTPQQIFVDTLNSMKLTMSELERYRVMLW